MAQGEGRGRAGWAPYGLTALSALLVIGWTRDFRSGLLYAAVAAGGLAAAGVLLGHAVRGARWHRAALIALFGALATGAFASERFHQIEFDWPAPAESRRAELRAELATRMADVMRRGRAGARRAAALADDGSLTAHLDEIRLDEGLDAILVTDSNAEFVTWSGDHRGEVPDEVRSPRSATWFAERPLFSYLYFIEPAPTGGAVMTAVLVEMELGGVREGAVSARGTVGSASGATFRTGGAPGADDWRLIADGDTIVHAVLPDITQASMRQGIEARARRFGVALALLALLFLDGAWVLRIGSPHGRLRTALPLALLTGAVAIAPIGAVLGIDPPFAASTFVLPGPGDVTLGTLVAIMVSLAALVATLRPPVLDLLRYRYALLAGATAVGLAYPAVLRVLIRSSSPTLLAGSTQLWFGVQVAAVLILGALTALALPRTGKRPEQRPEHALLGRRLAFSATGAIGVGGILALVVLWQSDPRELVPPWSAALWVLPFLLLAIAFVRYGGRSGALARWLAAGALAATAALPHLSVAQVHARLEAAAREVESLGMQLSPASEYVLRQFAAEVQTQYERGEQGLQLLYRSWVASGLAREPIGARITLWGPTGGVETEVSLGGAEGSDGESGNMRALALDNLDADQPEVHGFTGDPDRIAAITVPLGASRRIITVSVPPRRALGRPSVLAPFLGASPDPGLRLDMMTEPRREAVSDSVRWEPVPGGYRSDVRVFYPSGPQHAHTRVTLTPFLVLFARGVLLLAFDLLLFAVLWILGSLARGLSPLPREGISTLAASFRARVTVSLFAFFLVPTILFGLVAQRAFAREAERATNAVAVRAVGQAQQQYPQLDPDLRRVAQRVGAEILRYFDNGELIEASSTDAVGLGLFSAWMPRPEFVRLANREEAAIQTVRRVGGADYLVAYQIMVPTGILGVPISLSMGDVSVRQAELAHMILFAALIGALLSFALSIPVGRSLAGPIAQLGRAAAAVGAGRLRVRLPDRTGDEFGELYASFNRMVRRLRRARTRERETARVLAWGEMARQVAHEIKNPLTPIKLSVQHLRRANRDRSPDFDEVLEESVSQILKEIDRLTEIARAFSRYGAPEEGAPLEPVDVRRVVREALTLYRNSDDAIAFADDIADGLPPVIARHNEMKEVILNLVENAREALEGKGRILVRAVRAADDRIEVSVEDDGPGIPPDLMARVFDPHFSTRSTGTGLGLPIVRRLVESWGGTVGAQSEEGRGTTVRMRLVIAGRAP